MSRARERALLQTLALLALFLAFTAAVQTDVFRGLDREAVLTLQEHASPVLDVAGALATALGSAELELALAALGAAWLWRRGHPRAALALAFLFPLALIAAGLKAAIDHPGVPIDLNRYFLPRLPTHELRTAGSYPSGHVARATYLGGLALVALARRPPSARRHALAALALALIAFMAFSRPYLGEHWPTDVVGGLLFAAVPLPLVAHLWRPRKPHRVTNCELQIANCG